MYFNRKNAEQKNWRMIKKGKHFLFGCSLVFAVGAALVAPSVKADAVDAMPDACSTAVGVKPLLLELLLQLVLHKLGSLQPQLA